MFNSAKHKTLGLICILTLLSSHANARNLQDLLYPTPAGFTGYITYILDGELDVASPNPDVPGCFFNFCDGDYYWNEVIQATPEERSESERQAKVFFLRRFGLDVDALVSSGNILFRDTYIDPRLNYRARTISGTYVHKFGWEVHDQAFLVVFLNDTELGGDFTGEVVPSGSIVSFGQYAIEKSRLVYKRRKPSIISSGQFLVIKYQSGAPVTPPGLNRVLAFSCEVTDSPWGRGVAQGVGSTQILGDGLAPGSLQKQNLRNSLTFDGVNGLGNFPGVKN